MWNTYPVHELQKLKKIPFIEETLKEVRNDKNEKKRYIRDEINHIQKDRNWEEVFK
jgi:hypothetical protein